MEAKEANRVALFNKDTPKKLTRARILISIEAKAKDGETSGIFPKWEIDLISEDLKNLGYEIMEVTEEHFKDSYYKISWENV